MSIPDRVQRRVDEWLIAIDVYRATPRWRWRKRRKQMLKIKQLEVALDAR